jgi:LuxR family transcriptional regulator, maltose regulon positive regulatory protein
MSVSETRQRQPTGAENILRTKLMAPRVPAGLVQREALLSRLDEGLARKLTLITAPTGFGKTTLTSQWIHTRPFPSAWVSLDPADDDPNRFWDYLITALRSFDPALGRTALAALHTTQQPFSAGVILTPLINELAALPDPCVLVLEDYHAITSPEIHASVAFLLNHLPDGLHLVIISRIQPRLPLAILRARNQLVEIDAADLRFSLSEARALLAQASKGLAIDAVAAWLEERTEGWAAGLRLAAIALGNQVDAEQTERWLAGFSGSHPFISDYLIGEAFANQDAETQTFLLQTAFLSQVCGPLCDAVTGRDDADSRLAALEQANLFITQIGTGAGRLWYRYHPLFAEAIEQIARQQLGEASIRSQREQASRWFAEQGMLPEAIQAALEARAFDQAARQIEANLERRGLTELVSLRRWVEQIPPAVLTEHPEVCFNYAQALLYSTDRFSPATPALLEPWIEKAEAAWRTQGDEPRLGQALAFRGLVAWFHGDFQQAFQLSRQSLDQLPEQDIYWRGSALLAVAYDEIFSGRVGMALERTLEAKALLAAAQNEPGALAATQILADIYFLLGEMEQAEQTSRQVIVDARGGEEILDDQGSAWLCLSRVAYERDDLAEAERYARLAVDAGQRRSNEWLMAFAAAALAQTNAARGETGLAQAVLREAGAKVYHAYFRRELQAAQAWVAF